MTSEERADDIIAKFGMPKNRDVLHAMLAYAHQQGKVDGGEELRAAVRDEFARAAQVTS